MEMLSKAYAQEKEESSTFPRRISEALSLPSYKEYLALRPFVNTVMHHKPKTHMYCTSRLSSAHKAFPETSSAEILSALRNLQEKMRRLELEKEQAELGIHMVGTGASRAHLQREQGPRRLSSHARNQRDSDGETNAHPNYNQVLITQLAAAESRCVQLERQLDHMRRMVRHAKGDRTSLLKQHVSVTAAKSTDQGLDSVSENAQLEKLERLEQEYLRLTRTQNNAERKMHELEMKLQEEEHLRKLVQDKANLLQTGLEANRILLQSVSPHPAKRRSKERKMSSSKKPSQQPSHTEPHYRLSLGDVPFVAGTSVGCSHSVRANVQSVLSLLKQHQPQLCNSRVLSQTADHRCSGSSSGSSSSSSSSASGEELVELVQALQEELRLMSLEQDELMKQVEASVSEDERKGLQREQERLLLKMERKGEQISKLYKHRAQMKKLRKEAVGNHGRREEARGTATVTTRGRSAGTVKPGERSKWNLVLLKDMKALQTSLQSCQ